MTASSSRALRPGAFAALLLVAACRPTAPSGVRADTAGLEDVVARYEAATNAQDVESLAALYAPDAVLLPPDGGLVEGQDAIRAFWADGMEPGLSFEVVRVFATGDRGVVVGRFHLAPTDEAPADSGKYVLGLRREAGRWLVEADIWNATPSDEEQQEEEHADPRTRVIALRDISVLSTFIYKTSKYIAPQPRRP